MDRVSYEAVSADDVRRRVSRHLYVRVCVGVSEYVLAVA